MEKGYSYSSLVDVGTEHGYAPWKFLHAQELCLRGGRNVPHAFYKLSSMALVKGKHVIFFLKKRKIRERLSQGTRSAENASDILPFDI